MSGLQGESEIQKVKSFDSLCAYLRRASGLVLDADKRYLVESRVTPVMRRAGLSGLGELVRVLEQGRMPSLAQEVVQAMTINELRARRRNGSASGARRHRPGRSLIRFR